MYPDGPTPFAFTIILAVAAISTAGFSVVWGIFAVTSRDHGCGHPPLDPTRRAVAGPRSPSRHREGQLNAATDAISYASLALALCLGGPGLFLPRRRWAMKCSPTRGSRLPTPPALHRPGGRRPSGEAHDHAPDNVDVHLVDRARTAQHSARVDISGYGDGDSKWVPDVVSVKPNTYYTFSDWYKSDRSSAVSVYYVLSTDQGRRRRHPAGTGRTCSPASRRRRTGRNTRPASRCPPTRSGAVRALHRGNGYLRPTTTR